MRRSTGVLVFVLVFFFLFKVLRFQTLAYTFHDMYVFMQLATGWIDGRPFMYDNFWGDHQRIHNYYTVWLWGPIIYCLGAYGLFLVQTTLLLLAYALTNERLGRAGIPHWVRYGLLIVILLGPVSFWLNDHTSMGWHSELTYLPLGMLLALALTGRGLIWPVAAGLGVVLVKEDGAVLAAVIHLGYVSLLYLHQHPDRSLGSLLGKRRFWYISLGWGVIFIAGMIWLRYQNTVAEPRLQIALSLIAQQADTRLFWLRVGQECGGTLLLLLPAICFMGLIINQSGLTIGRHLLLVYGLGVAALVIMNFVQSAFYYNDPSPPAYHLLGLTWPPRFVLPWAFTAAFIASMLLVLPLPQRPLPGRPLWLILGSLMLIQLPVLKLVRPDLPGFSEAKALVQGRGSPFKESRYLDAGDLRKIQCLAGQLPARSDVMAFDYIQPYFHRHYLIWAISPHHPYRPADLAVLPIAPDAALRTAFEKAIAADMRRPYRIIRLKGYLLYVAVDYQQFVQPCITDL